MSVVAVALASLLLVACAGDPARAPSPNVEIHTLAFGGDVILGRRLNRRLLDEHASDPLFGGVADLLRDADVAVANAEGVISFGGTFTDKGEPRPIVYRAHPRAADLLAEAGLDVLTVANNHVGDMGREAFVEMLDRLRLAGLEYAGGGYDATDALRPAFVRAGDLMVAVVGVDLTNTKPYAADSRRAGSLVLDGRDPSRVGRNARRLLAVEKEARACADLVVLSPHWGDNWMEEPTPETRELARRLLEGGYDAILGHSAHLFQGVELIGGKPVVYDAGNLLLDYPGRGGAHDAMLYELDFARSARGAGFVGLRAHPLLLGELSVARARGVEARRLLERLDALSRRLGTPLRVEEDRAELAINARPPHKRRPLAEPPPRPQPLELREAPHERLLDALPPSAKPLGVRFPGGIELLGAEILLDRLPTHITGNIVTLYWRTDRVQEPGIYVHNETRGLSAGGSDARDVDLHLPGDWMLPVERWPVGRVVVDTTLLRLQNVRAGEVLFLTGLERGGLIEPESAPMPLIDGALVPIARVPHEPGAPGIFKVLKQRRTPP